MEYKKERKNVPGKLLRIEWVLMKGGISWSNESSVKRFS